MSQGEMALTQGGGTWGTGLNATFENPKFTSFPKQLNTDHIIQRGYMRVLSEVYELGEGGNRINTADNTVHEALQHEVGSKLNFQFNPDTLNRSVTARTDTQLWINQSPSQLLQPGIGDMNFGWSMLFNREAEVTNNYIARMKLNARNLEGSADSGLDAWADRGMTGTTAAAVQLLDPAFDNVDFLTVSRLLARAILSLGFDLILCGRQPAYMTAEARVGEKLVPSAY